jgi:hypothetical protein
MRTPFFDDERGAVINYQVYNSGMVLIAPRQFCYLKAAKRLSDGGLLLSYRPATHASVTEEKYVTGLLHRCAHYVTVPKPGRLRYVYFQHVRGKNFVCVCKTMRDLILWCFVVGVKASACGNIPDWMVAKKSPSNLMDEYEHISQLLKERPSTAGAAAASS